MRELNLKVKGKVQGVFYRAAIKDAAEQLNLKGFAKNEDDGSVNIKAQGREENLMKLIEKVWKGSMSCNVEDVEEEWRHSAERFERFQIL